MAHLNRAHRDYVKIYDVQRGQDSSAILDKIWAATEDAKKHFWMRKVVLLPEPFNYVENPIAREVLATALTIYDYNIIIIKLYVILICRG